MRPTTAHRCASGILPTIVLLAGFLMIAAEKTSGEDPELLATSSGEETGVRLKIGAGESVKDDAKAAVEEAYQEMLAGLDNQKPQFVVLFGEVSYDSDEILAELNRLLGSGVRILGATSLVGVMSNGGFSIGDNGSLAMMGFSSSDMTLGLGVSVLDDTSSASEAGRAAALNALEDAGKGIEEKPKIVLIYTGSFELGIDEEILSGIVEVFGNDVPVVGGVASDTHFAGNWRVFANTRSYQKGVVVGAIYTDLKVGYKFLCGFNPTQTEGVATKIADKGRKIKEIDQRPADVVYNEWLDGLLTEKLGTDGFFIDVTCLHPLGERIVEVGGIANYRLIYPHHFNVDSSLTVGSDVKEGGIVYLLEGSRDMLVERPALTARLARSLGRITEEEIAGGLMDYCSGTMLCIPEEARDAIGPKINDALGNAPFIGLFSCGEFGYFAGVGNKFGNCMSSMIVFSKR